MWYMIIPGKPVTLYVFTALYGDKFFGFLVISDQYQRHGENTGDKLFTTLNFTGVNDTADKFFTGVVDTGDKTLLTISACLGLEN